MKQDDQQSGICWSFAVFSACWLFHQLFWRYGFDDSLRLGGNFSGLLFVLAQFTVIDMVPTPYITSAIVGVWYPFAFNKIGVKKRINSGTG